jgi:hypothetical protein
VVGPVLAFAPWVASALNKINNVRIVMGMSLEPARIVEEKDRVVRALKLGLSSCDYY